MFIPQVPMTAQDGNIIGFLHVSDPDNDGENKNKQSHVCQITEGSEFFAVDQVDGKIAVKVGHRYS